MFRITSSYTLAGGFEDVDSPYLGASALVETWFNRANRHPLSITLRCMDRATLPLSILPAIAKFAGQWQRLEVLLRGGIPPILPQIRGIFPMLKEVVIELPFSSSMSSSMVPAIFLPVEAPELHRIRLLGGCRFHHLGTAPSPLVSLEINRISLDNLSSIFRAFPSLRRFSAHIDLPVAVSHIPQTFNDSLHELEVLGYGTHALQFLTLPCLQRLQCSVREHVLPILVSFLSRSSCNLQHLSLKETRADLALEVLHAIPSLFTLDFEGERTRDLYEHLQSRALVPQLTHLSISEYDDEYRQAPVVAMLLSRRVAPAQLVSFELTLGTTDHDAVDTELPTHALPLQLKHLISQGLLIRVRRSRSFRSVE
ncbi:hypothetical protein C8J57DRAFT_1309375 [Mycena rebaudengoi]|nr:hypothetical protein C8J57DRAFT_1309375 [Mycena rebaudengoi]